MVRTAVVILGGALALSAPASAQMPPFFDWAAQNSPFGLDITPDGTLWINVATVGQEDDYAIRAEDLFNAQKSTEQYFTFWVRGYHKKNPQVSYRESKARYSIDCRRETIASTMTVLYDSNGRSVGSEGPRGSEYIVPGTYAAEYFRLFCVASR